MGSDDHISGIEENIENDYLAQRCLNQILNSSMIKDSNKKLNSSEFTSNKKSPTIYPDSSPHSFGTFNQAPSTKFSNNDNYNYAFLSDEKKERHFIKISNNSNSNDLFLSKNLISDNSNENFENDDSKSKQIIYIYFYFLAI